MSGIPLTAINGGMNRLRVKGAARRDTLYQLTNGYVTAGSTIKARPGTIRNVDLAATTGAGATKGLVAYGGSRHIFSDHVVPVPAGYTLHVLNHPAQQTNYVPTNPASSGTGWNPLVQSLLHFEDGSGSTAFTDSGTSPSTWTAIGIGAESTAQAKFGTGSLTWQPSRTAASGAQTPLTLGSNTDVYSGNGDFTIEFWFMPDTAGIAGGATFSLFDSGRPQAYGLRIWNNGTQVSVDAGAGNFTTLNFVASGITAGVWAHVAVCRDNDIIRMYVNGVQGGAVNLTNFGNPPANAQTTLGLAASVGGNTTSTYFMDDFRLTKGACLYGGPFTPPGATLSTVASPAYRIAELLHFDDGQSSTTFTDSVGTQVWTAVGAAIETTTQNKFGGGSGQFLNSADYIKTPVTANASADITNSTQDFTFECFYRPSAVGAGTYVIADMTETSNGAPNATGFRMYSNGPDCVVKAQPSGTTLTAAGVFTATAVWYHIALVARGFSHYLYVNGILAAGPTAIASRPVITSGARHFIGSQYGTASTTANGYVDEVRLVTGLGVYKANFTPPVAPYTAPGVIPIALKEIHFAAPFLGFLYVVAEFVADAASAALGSVFHYWLQTSGVWTANTPYQVGQIVSPTVANGLTFKATRVGTPKPAWAPSTLHAVNDIVEPTVANGYKFKATAVDGTNPITGTTEPTWPTTDGAVVYEESEKTDTGAVTAPATQPNQNTPSPGTRGKYTNPYRGAVLIT